MKVGISMFVAAAALAFAPPSAAPPPAAAPESEVQKWVDRGNQQWIDGFRHADAASIAASFAEDAVNVGRDGTCDRGRDAIAARMREYLRLSGPATEARVDPGRLVVDGDLAYEWGRSDARFAGRPGGPARRTGRYVTVWKRQADGSWKIFRNNSLPE